MAREGCWTVLSLDPSVNDCGFAGWYHGRPVQYGALHPPRRLKDWRLKAASVRDQVAGLVRTYDPLFVIAESPETIYQSRHVDQDGTLRLAYMVGMLASVIHAAPARPRFFLEVTPARWKGRAPKEATLAYVNNRYGLSLTDKKVDLDISDAIGIGSWFNDKSSVEMLGKGLHAPCSQDRVEMLHQALSTTGWRSVSPKATGRK